MPPKHSHKSRRERGVILTAQGRQKLQQMMRAAEIERNGGQYFTQEQLSEYTGLSLNMIARILKQEQTVDKRSLVRFLQAFDSQLLKEDYTQSVCSPKNLEVRQPNQQQDWGEATDVAVFYGREAELLQLQQWIVQEHCRLVALLSQSVTWSHRQGLVCQFQSGWSGSG
ncbi:MAG: hypothetical protein KME28_04935 [Pelatocladus maniniholoensis HA4357-MV3]|jgi:transcriptional regulator with XRE-family HTH domain|uniref:HTH cro/C1-type domain-containing protein n=1 Tax=Pelatocladus maniniholoensis HA4357-MV3 TaxID=1117104 RepID=A0A9E3LRU0_9NOST|nr:hypothetical protein [Pelatocladus maniniholoensis HA4357-MV3]